jgi:hypothetical protein
MGELLGAQMDGPSRLLTRTLMGVMFTKTLFDQTTLTQTLDLIRDHPKLRVAIGSFP